MPNTVVDYLHVVVAVIRRADGQILLAQRPLHKHQGGKWEFPGGKVELGESPWQALERELYEELGITPLQAQPLIKVKYHYPERSVLLDVWDVTDFSGEAQGREQQPVAWFSASNLTHLEFPPANYPIINAVRLPSHYLITPEPHDTSIFLAQLEQSLVSGVKLIQFRAKTLSASIYSKLAEKVLAQAQAFNAQVLLNSPPDFCSQAAGLHLTSLQLQNLAQRPAELADKWLAASCHTAADLAKAAKLGVDFAVLSPVLPTASHANAPVLGWEQFARLVDAVNFPVYALGGMQRRHVDIARTHGAQGIAAIRGLWPSA